MADDWVLSVFFSDGFAGTTRRERDIVHTVPGEERTIALTISGRKGLRTRVEQFA